MTGELVMLLSTLVLGAGAAVMSCCNVAMVGAVAGFGMTSSASERTNMRVAAASFVSGTVISLSVLGSVAGLVSAAAGERLGFWWSTAAGAVMIAFGTATLGGVRVPAPRWLGTLGQRVAGSQNRVAPAAFGLALGGVQTACSTACLCNPAMVAALAFAVQGGAMWGAGVMAIYALGYSLPLVVAFLGIGFGSARLARRSQVWAKRVRWGASWLLVGVGFYLILRP